MLPIALLMIAPFLPDAIKAADPEHWQTTPIPPIAMPRSAEYDRMMARERAVAEMERVLANFRRNEKRRAAEADQWNLEIWREKVELDRRIEELKRLQDERVKRDPAK
jgi:hypothetical protein